MAMMSAETTASGSRPPASARAGTDSFADRTATEEASVRLLVVDDEPDIVEEMAEYLRAKGFDCETAFDALEALRRIQADPEIALVLTDIRMPGMSGLELMRRLRDEAGRDMEVIVLTGHAGRDEAIQALQAGAADFLTKPISLRELVHSAARTVETIRTRRAERRYRTALEHSLGKERQLNRLQREFVSMVSHEFRTPLAIIDGAAQRLVRRKGALKPHDVAEKTERIRKAVARMTTLIDSTLCASRLDAGKIELSRRPFDLAEVVAGVVARQAEISTDHDFVVDMADLPPAVYADPEYIERVFANLVSNAVKYSGRQPRIEIAGWSEGNVAAVSVRDHGVGIPSDQVPRLFQRFFRARTAAGIPGTGIGLHLVRELVEMHGGTIDVVSEEGAGTTFTVRLASAPSANDWDI